MPEHIKGCRRLPIIHAWAIGGSTFNYPENAGLSFGAENDPNFFLMEMHYDNPKRLNGLVDESGLRLYMTTELRPMEAGILTVGSTTSKSQLIIPPKQTSFVNTGFCSGTCFHENVTQQKPKVFASFLHAHLQGRKIVARLVRDSDGVEVKRILQDLNYDFNFQEVKYLPEMIEIPAGHSIHVECTYNTMAYDKPVLGGESTQEEMCLAFLWHYPIMKPRMCLSFPTFQYSPFQRNELGWKIYYDKTRQRSIINESLILDGKQFRGNDAWRALTTAEVWTKYPNIAKKYQDYATLPNSGTICGNRLGPYIKPKLTKKLPYDACAAQNKPTGAATMVSISFHLLSGLAIVTALHLVKGGM